MSPSVSIVIACYNDPFVVEAVRSASNQTYDNIEIIIVDDGSNRETASLIQSLKESVDHILVQPNSGQSIARNRAIEIAKGELILNLDSDDFFEPEFCEKAVEVFQKEKDVKIVTCKARRFSESGESDIFVPAGGNIEDFLFSNSALGSAMFRRKDWESVGGYEEVLPILGFEDWELYINILKNGGTAYVLDEVLFNYRIRKNSTTARIKHYKNEKFRKIISKHKELYLENFDGLIDNLFKRLKHSGEQVLKTENKPEFRAGSFLIRPFRALKSIFK